MQNFVSQSINRTNDSIFLNLLNPFFFFLNLLNLKCTEMKLLFPTFYNWRWKNFTVNTCMPTLVSTINILYSTCFIIYIHLSIPLSIYQFMFFCGGCISGVLFFCRVCFVNIFFWSFQFLIVPLNDHVLNFYDAKFASYWSYQFKFILGEIDPRFP